MNTYLPGRSWLHRLPAAAKLASLLVLLAGTLLLSSPLAIAVATVVTVSLYASAGLIRVAPAQVRPMRWLVLGLFVLQTLTAGWVAAVVVTGRLLIAVALAGLVTLTTKVVDLLDVLERLLHPLRHVGVDSERVALVLALAIRTVPVVAGHCGRDLRGGDGGVGAGRTARSAPAIGCARRNA